MEQVTAHRKEWKIQIKYFKKSNTIDKAFDDNNIYINPELPQVYNIQSTNKCLFVEQIS